MASFVKCRYKHCIHPEDDKVPKEEMIKEGSTYYHKDCYEIKNNINEIIDLYCKKIGGHFTMAQLRKVINDIIFNKGNDSKFLLFGINYYINHGIKINNPAGLYYVLQNQDMIKQWNRLYVRKETKKEDVFKIEEKSFHRFNFKPQKNKTFSDMFTKKGV